MISLGYVGDVFEQPPFASSHIHFSASMGAELNLALGFHANPSEYGLSNMLLELSVVDCIFDGEYTINESFNTS